MSSEEENSMLEEEEGEFEMSNDPMMMINEEGEDEMSEEGEEE